MEAKEIKEIVIISVEKDYYAKHIDIFKSDKVKVKSVYVINEDHNDDLIYKSLLKEYLKAQTKLRDYEFDKRHNFNKNNKG